MKRTLKAIVADLYKGIILPFMILSRIAMILCYVANYLTQYDKKLNKWINQEKTPIQEVLEAHESAKQ